MMSDLISFADEAECHLTTNQISSFRIFMHLGQPFILCKANSSYQSTTITLQQASKEYMCEFVKELDTQYRTALEQIITSIDISESFATINHSFRLYKILGYQPTSFISYNIAHTVYGDQVIIKRKNAKIATSVSNCFRQNNRCFYFISNEEQQKEESISEIIDSSQTKIYGFSVMIGKLNLCLTLQELLYDVASPFMVKIEIKQSLKKVVYVIHESSHCTGMLIYPNFVLTVRHLFDTTEPPMGTIVKVRVYPYKQLKLAKIIFTSTKFVDLLLLQLIQQLNASQQTVSFSQLLHRLPQPKPSQVRIGMKIYAIGFGKYSYQNLNFNSIDLLLPTITFGVVSKIITHNSKKVYFKTDSSLYNGYSGCPIWHNGSWIGNTVFIVKNKISLNKHPKHNFNYTRQFIHHFISKQNEVQKSQQLQQFFRRVQGIHTRKQIKIIAKL